MSTTPAAPIRPQVKGFVLTSPAPGTALHPTPREVSDRGQRWRRVCDVLAARAETLRSLRDQLANRAAALDARAAQLDARERELAAQATELEKSRRRLDASAAKIERCGAMLTQQAADLAARERAIQRRAEELARREQQTGALPAQPASLPAEFETRVEALSSGIGDHVRDATARATGRSADGPAPADDAARSGRQVTDHCVPVGAG